MSVFEIIRSPRYSSYFFLTIRQSTTASFCASATTNSTQYGLSSASWRLAHPLLLRLCCRRQECPPVRFLGFLPGWRALGCCSGAAYLTLPLNSWIWSVSCRGIPPRTRYHFCRHFSRPPWLPRDSPLVLLNCPRNTAWYSHKLLNLSGARKALASRSLWYSRSVSV